MGLLCFSFWLCFDFFPCPQTVTIIHSRSGNALTSSLFDGIVLVFFSLCYSQEAKGIPAAGCAGVVVVTILEVKLLPWRMLDLRSKLGSCNSTRNVAYF